MNTAKRYGLPLVLGGLVLFLAACNVANVQTGPTQTKK